MLKTLVANLININGINNGLIIKVLTKTIIGKSPTHITFDKPFPNKCLGVIAQISNKTSFGVTIDCSDYNSNGFYTRLSIDGGASFLFYAFGY